MPPTSTPTPAPRGPDPLTATRVEHDLLGEREVPAGAYWGIHTLRALENFPVTGIPIGRYPALVDALAAVKAAAAVTNAGCGVLEAPVATAIVETSREIRSGALRDQFVVDVIQGGAGTSTNMNANEVIANRAIELLGHDRGRYDVVHPIEHVNLSQSTNDVYPTAVRLALLRAVDDLLAEMTRLSASLQRQAGRFADLLKIGRTQLQEAVPMTLGQELAAFATAVQAERRPLLDVAQQLRAIHLGGTAVGTGLTAPVGYREAVVDALSRESGELLRLTDDPMEATWGTGDLVRLSGALRGLAVRLSKISNDLRLLSSGPRAGFAEIRLPAVQAGSSIMPGKVNPVIPEVVNQIAFAVIGRDVTVTLASEAAQLQLNAFEPVMVVSLLDSADQLGTACRLLAERCIDGLEPNRERLAEGLERSVGLVTALLPLIGYEAATQAAARALADGTSVLTTLEDHGLAGLLPAALLGPVALQPWRTQP